MQTARIASNGSIVDKTIRKSRFRALPTIGVIGFIAIAIFSAPAASRRSESVFTPQEQTEKTLAQAVKAVEAGKGFLDTLDDQQRARAMLEFDSTKKSGWSNLPINMVPRNGVRMGDLNAKQREAAFTLLATVLSKAGYQKVIDIMDADQELTTGKGGGKGKAGGKGKVTFGKDNYFLAIFGTPSTAKPWFVQFGGHHLGVNVTLVGKNFVLAPTHTGAQPASFSRDGKTVRPLGSEQDRAFELVGSLDENQRSQAILKDRVNNLVLGPGQDGKRIEPKGIKGTALNESQLAKLLELIGEWINITQDESAAAKMAQIKSNLGDTYFAWSGPTTKGSAAYFRVQGPAVVIEYAPQGNTDHIHTVIRDPGNDYGQKLIQTK
jgi:Protein of unknown function (DUF3500)